jgi:transcriptional antiterminator NusG
VPQAEAGIEEVTQPDPENAPEPAPAAPPELAEPVEAEAAVAHTEESQSEELVPVQQPESEQLVPVHDVVDAAFAVAPHLTEEPATEEPKTDEEAPAPKPKKPRAPKKAAAASPATTAGEPAEPTGTVEGVTAEAPPESKKKWYAIKVQSGREDTIKSAILRKVAIEGLEEYFGRIEIPVEEEVIKKTVRVKDKKTGDYTTQEKKVTRKKKKFQGYLFAELEFNDRILYLFRETSGVGDFLNLRGTPPVPEPMPEHEVKAMLTGERVVDPSKKGGKVKVKLDFEKGDRVRVREDSFAGQEGEVKAITEPKDPTDTPKVTVVLTFWGRPLEVELDYWKVEKV